MKRIILIIVSTILFAVSAFSQNGSALYNKYSDEKGVEAVYISGAMFRMIGRIPDLEIGDKDMNIAPVIRRLSGFFVLSTENPSVSERLFKDVSDYIKKGRFELLMEAKDSGEVMRMYTVTEKDVIKSFVMVETEGSETNVICFDGEIPRAELDKLISSAMKN